MMSDYLGNLVARSLALVPGVQPQLPSLFEPTQPGRQPKSEFDLEQENFTQSQPIAHRAERPPPIPLAAESRTQSTGARTALSASPTEERADKAVRTPIADVVRPAPQKPLREREESFSATKARPEPAIAPVTPESRQNDLPARRLETNSSRSRREEALTLISETTALDSQPRSQSFLTSAPTIKKALAVQSVVPAIRALPPVSHTPAPPPASTINVTIGSVEIRAVTPPIRSRAQPKPATILSLEDYLRQRANGGGR